LSTSMGDSKKKTTKKGTGKRKREQEALEPSEKTLRINPSTIKNKQKRQEQAAKLRVEKKKARKKNKLQRQKDAEALGEEAPPKQQPRTLENTREVDETIVRPDDEEVKAADAIDEWAKYFSGSVHPKICITTCYRATKVMYDFIRDLLLIFPNSFYYERKRFPLKKIIEEAKEKGYTDIIVINEDRKTINALTIIHLPKGPTAYFKLSNVMLAKDVPNRGEPTGHRPEVILNKFSTRLGLRVGRMLGALFHQEPHFKGRRVVTFHNQRDFIFFRHHRYIFDSTSKARLQEIGPRFTLKLQWIQHGTFDTAHGSYEWIHKPELDTSRRRFFL